MDEICKKCICQRYCETTPEKCKHHKIYEKKQKEKEDDRENL